MELSSKSTGTQIPDTRRQPKWYRAYYLLAAFDVLVVLLGLYLNHQIVGTYNQSVVVNQEWVKRLSSYAEIGQLAGAVNAPGNDVFDSHDAEGESEKMRVALRAFDEKLAAVEKDLQDEISSEKLSEQDTVQQSIKKLPENLKEIKSAMSEMTGEAELIFSYFSQNQPELAGRRMATMDRKYANLNRALAQSRGKIDVIQQELLDKQATIAAAQQKFEYLIALFVSLMITGALIYGHKIKKQIESGERERERHLEDLQEAEAALRQSHDDLELRVKERTAELARANEVLSESETKFRSVTQSANDAIIAADSKGQIISWNNGASRIFGYDEAEVLGSPLTRIMPEAYRTAHQKELERHAATGESRVIGQTVELHGLRKDGQEFPLELSLTSWETGEERFYSGIIRDITERKQAENALRQSEEKNRELVENASDVIYTLDLSGGFTSLNRAGEQLIGYTEAEALELKIADLISREDAQLVHQAIVNNKGAELPDFELEIFAKNGGSVTLDISSRLIYKDGEPLVISPFRSPV